MRHVGSAKDTLARACFAGHLLFRLEKMRHVRCTQRLIRLGSLDAREVAARWHTRRGTSGRVDAAYCVLRITYSRAHFASFVVGHPALPYCVLWRDMAQDPDTVAGSRG